jgi:hypothetical protein
MQKHTILFSLSAVIGMWLVHASNMPGKNKKGYFDAKLAIGYTLKSYKEKMYFELHREVHKAISNQLTETGVKPNPQLVREQYQYYMHALNTLKICAAAEPPSEKKRSIDRRVPHELISYTDDLLSQNNINPGNVNIRVEKLGGHSAEILLSIAMQQPCMTVKLVDITIILDAKKLRSPFVHPSWIKRWVAHEIAHCVNGIEVILPFFEFSESDAQKIGRRAEKAADVIPALTSLPHALAWASQMYADNAYVNYDGAKLMDDGIHTTPSYQLYKARQILYLWYQHVTDEEKKAIKFALKKYK